MKLERDISKFAAELKHASIDHTKMLGEFRKGKSARKLEREKLEREKKKLESIVADMKTGKISRSTVSFLQSWQSKSQANLKESGTSSSLAINDWQDAPAAHEKIEQKPLESQTDIEEKQQGRGNSTICCCPSYWTKESKELRKKLSAIKAKLKAAKKKEADKEKKEEEKRKKEMKNMTPEKRYRNALFVLEKAENVDEDEKQKEKKADIADIAEFADTDTAENEDQTSENDKHWVGSI